MADLEHSCLWLHPALHLKLILVGVSGAALGLSKKALPKARIVHTLPDVLSLSNFISKVEVAKLRNSS